MRRGYHIALGLGPRLGLLLAQRRQPIFVRFNVALHFEHGSLKLKDLRLLCITLLEKASLIGELLLEAWKLLLDGGGLGFKRPDLSADSVEIGFGVGIVQLHQWLSLHHRIAIVNQNLADDPPLKMLHGLAVAVDLHHARRNRGAGERRKRRPKTEASEQGCNHDLAFDDIGLDRWLGRDVDRQANASALRCMWDKLPHCPPPLTTRIGGLTPAFRGLFNCARTASRGPNNCTWPSCNTRIWSN